MLLWFLYGACSTMLVGSRRLILIVIAHEGIATCSLFWMIHYTTYTCMPFRLFMLRPSFENLLLILMQSTNMLFW